VFEVAFQFRFSLIDNFVVNAYLEAFGFHSFVWNDTPVDGVINVSRENL